MGHGGWRPNSGRKPLSFYEKHGGKYKLMEPAFLKSLLEGITLRDPTCMKIFAEQYYGKPIQQVSTDITTNGQSINGFTIEVIRALPSTLNIEAEEIPMVEAKAIPGPIIQPQAIEKDIPQG